MFYFYDCENRCHRSGGAFQADGYLYFPPIVNWGRYRAENGRLMMPVSVRLNHAIADGFLVANVYRLLEKAQIMTEFMKSVRASGRHECQSN